MPHFVEGHGFHLATFQDSLQPRKVFLPPPGLGAVPGVADAPGFGFPNLTGRVCSAPPGFHSPAAVDVNNFASVDLGYLSSMHLIESQHLSLMHSWTLADQDSWDKLYETCTAAALGRVDTLDQGQIDPLCRMKTCGSRSDVSEETDSTADTSLGGEHEIIVVGDSIDSLSHALLTDGDEQDRAFYSVVDQLRNMCQTRDGSVLAQSAVAVATGTRADVLLTKLCSFLPEACRSPHGNHVVLACIRVLGSEKAHVLVDALSGKAVQMARDRFGCRIAQHLVEVCPAEHVAAFVDELMTDAERMCRHPFGNYVMQAVVKFGTAARCSEVANVLLGDAPELSKQRFAKHVFSLAVVHCEPSDQTRLLAASRRSIAYFVK